MYFCNFFDLLLLEFWPTGDTTSTHIIDTNIHVFQIPKTSANVTGMIRVNPTDQAS